MSHLSVASPARSLHCCAGAILLIALALAPLNYGSTRPAGVALLIALLLLGGCAWLVAGAWQRRLPLPPKPVLLGAVLLGVSSLAWCAWLTPPAAPEFTRAHLVRITERWPFSVVPRDFGISLALLAASILALFALTDFARDFAWRQAMGITILATGAGVAVLGLLQNATGARGIYWDASQPMPGAFFGTFFHHTAAGAYLNTVWPLGFGLGLAFLQRRKAEAAIGRVAIYAVFAATLVVLVAHAGHISRFPQVIAFVTLLAFGLWSRAWSRLTEMRGLRRSLAVAVVVAVLGVVALGATRFSTISSRWSQLTIRATRDAHEVKAPPPVAEWPKLMRDDLFIPSDHRNYVLGDRGATYAAACTAIAQRPWFGWGPGGWPAAAAANSLDPFVRTFFLTVQFTHNDFLQTCVEWGLVGAAGWVLLLPGAAVNAFARLGLNPSQDYIGASAGVALTAVLIQSLIDFPLQIPAVQFNAVALAALAWTTPVTVTATASRPNFTHERI